MFIAPFGISRAWLLPKDSAERRGREELDAHRWRNSNDFEPLNSKSLPQCSVPMKPNFTALPGPLPLLPLDSTATGYRNENFHFLADVTCDCACDV